MTAVPFFYNLLIPKMEKLNIHIIYYLFYGKNFEDIPSLTKCLHNGSILYKYLGYIITYRAYMQHVLAIKCLTALLARLISSAEPARFDDVLRLITLRELIFVRTSHKPSL